MRCKIADLIVEVPEAGGMAPRCQGYLYEGTQNPDITIFEKSYRTEVWPGLSKENVVYLESGIQFYSQLTKYNGLMLHSSAVTLGNRAYLFSGPCGMGKSTHTNLWKSYFGESARIINDDKPALRKMEGKWYAYGTPWCGKAGINLNEKIPLVGIWFLQRGENNVIRRLNTTEALVKVISQTRRRYVDAYMTDLMLKNVERLITDIPVFELFCNMELDAVKCSYSKMYQCAEEMGL